MSTPTTKRIQTTAIIGAGLSGLSLALFLARQGIRTTIYEMRRAEATSAGAIMLSPNALATLDVLGIHEQIRARGYSFRQLHFNTNDEHRTVDRYEMGNADRYGYDALRVYRHVVLDALKAAVAREPGVEVVYEKKFARVVTEHDGTAAAAAEEGEEGRAGATFEFADGERKTADLLVGADGIHSAVRKHLLPGVEPSFSGFLAITGTVARAQIEFPVAPEPYPLPVGVHGSAGAFVLAPQDAEARECLAGIQYRTHARTRAGWEALARDKAGLMGMLREQYGAWNGMVRSILDAMAPDALTTWPFYTVPSLERWSSPATGRVVIVGDAAHAIPPAAGQGVNQAFEDVHTLALLIEAVNAGEADWMESLGWWKEYRQARVERIQALTDEMNKRRSPGWTGEGAETIDSSWLFSVDIPHEVQTWLQG